MYIQNHDKNVVDMHIIITQSNLSHIVIGRIVHARPGQESMRRYCTVVRSLSDTYKDERRSHHRQSRIDTVLIQFV